MLRGTSFVAETISVGGEPNRDLTPDERERLRLANQKKLSEVMAMFNWTSDDFDRAKSFGFPDPIAFTSTGWLGGREAVYRLDRINAWRESVLAFAATLKK